jgi:hypothetical protein
MWTVIKSDKKKFSFLKRDLKDKLGQDTIIYSPKILIDKFKKNKKINTEFNLLGDYIFCYHKKLCNPLIINSLKFSRGLKYFLGGFITSQNEIIEFIEGCKKLENKNGYITQNIFEALVNKKYKFSSGPFTNQIFKIINMQKDKISISIGNLKTRINKKEFLFYPV